MKKFIKSLENKANSAIISANTAIESTAGAGLTHENFSQKYVKHNGKKRYFDTVDKV